jgi:opacity protein-like surface antigen
MNTISATNLVNQVFAESQTWLDLNVLLQYQLNPKSRFNPYVTLGPGISYLLGTSSSGPTTRGTTGNVVSGPAIDLANSYNKTVYSVTAGAGAKIKVGSLYVTGELRYQYGLVNAVNPEKRTNVEYTFDYAAQLNDFSVNNVSFMIGASIPVFKPQKLKKKK